VVDGWVVDGWVIGGWVVEVVGAVVLGRAVVGVEVVVEVEVVVGVVLVGAAVVGTVVGVAVVGAAVVGVAVVGVAVVGTVVGFVVVVDRVVVGVTDVGVGLAEVGSVVVVARPPVEAVGDVVAAVVVVAPDCVSGAVVVVVVATGNTVDGSVTAPLTITPPAVTASARLVGDAGSTSPPPADAAAPAAVPGASWSGWVVAPTWGGGDDEPPVGRPLVVGEASSVVVDATCPLDRSVPSTTSMSASGSLDSVPVGMSPPPSASWTMADGVATSPTPGSSAPTVNNGNSAMTTAGRAEVGSPNMSLRPHHPRSAPGLDAGRRDPSSGPEAATRIPSIDSGGVGRASIVSPSGSEIVRDDWAWNSNVCSRPGVSMGDVVVGSVDSTAVTHAGTARPSNRANRSRHLDRPRWAIWRTASGCLSSSSPISRYEKS
jgi:hypothetical protein